MKAILINLLLVCVIVCGCALNPKIGLTIIETDMVTIYSKTVEYENGDLPLNDLKWVWAKRDVTLRNSRVFWENYEKLRGKIGEKKAERWLSALITSQGVASILISPHIRDAVNAEFLMAEIQRTNKRTRFFRFVAGDPMQHEKLLRYRKSGEY